MKGASCTSWHSIKLVACVLRAKEQSKTKCARQCVSTKACKKYSTPMHFILAFFVDKNVKRKRGKQTIFKKAFLIVLVHIVYFPM